MPVGHKRFNEKRANPNDNITFIRVMEGLPDSDMALKILEALAAQFKPIMKEWGFGVNSLVEHEWNSTFAGRNWNAGEVIEIVLRRRDGTFAPYQFLLYVMCHELAHIREMNHSWSFQKVNKQIRAAVAQLRAQRYYGDGFWSSGRSLVYPDADTPFAPEDEPTFACGGANKRSPRWRRRRSTAAQAGPSRARGSAVKLGTTGRQTAIAPKAGVRVKRKGAFEGDGQVLSEDPAMRSFRRRAQAKGAVEARAAAAEARLAAEKRAKAAEARARDAPLPDSPDKKNEVKLEAKDEEADGWEDAGGVEADVEIERGEWETELDANEVKLEQDEQRWLEEDMRSWRETFADDDEDIKPGIDGGSSGKGKGKGKGTASGAPSSSAKKRKASSPVPRASPKTSGSKARAGDLDLPDDLTPEERAWIEADLSGSHDVEEGAGKKVRVAYMPMPEWMGGQKKKVKDKGVFDTVSISDSSDEGEASSTPATSRASSKSTTKGNTRASTPPTDDHEDVRVKAVPVVSSSKRKRRESSEEHEPPPRPAAAKGKARTVRPPSDDDDPPQQKKVRKTRSDKGKKREPYKKSGVDDDEDEEGGVGGKGRKRGGSTRKEPETYAARVKAVVRAKEMEKHRGLLEEIDEEEAQAAKVVPGAKAEGKGKERAKKKARVVAPPPDDEGEDDEIDWTDDDGSRAAVKGKGKDKDEAANLVVVGLELHAQPRGTRDTQSPHLLPPGDLASRRHTVEAPSRMSWPPRLSTEHYFDLSSDERDAFLDFLDREDAGNRQGEVRQVAGLAARGNGKAGRESKWRCATCGFDNDADLSTCVMCEVGIRAQCEGWI